MDWNLKSFTAPSGELIRKEAQRDPELGFKLYVPMFNPALSEDKRQSFEVSQAKERAEGCGKYRLVASSSFEAHGDVLVKLIETLQRVGTEVRLLESENLYLTFTELYANAVTDSLVTDAKPRADPCDRNNYQQKG
jgi:hypothetical protein